MEGNIQNQSLPNTLSTPPSAPISNQELRKMPIVKSGLEGQGTTFPVLLFGAVFAIVFAAEAVMIIVGIVKHTSKDKWISFIIKWLIILTITFVLPFIVNHVFNALGLGSLFPLVSL
jgi:hypothetical protein